MKIRPHTTCQSDDRQVNALMRHSPSGMRQSAAFTFIEVLFAVIILGVGMIMIAGILPVAIKQNSDTRDDITGKAIAESGYAMITQAMAQYQDAFIPTTGFTAYDDGSSPTIGRMVPMNYAVVHSTPLFQRFQLIPTLGSSRISSADPRFQWLGFYRVDRDADVARFVVLALRLHNTDSAEHYSSDKTMPNEVINGGNGPFNVKVEVRDGGVDDADQLRFVGTSPYNMDTVVAATGAFVIINHSPPSGTADPNRPYRNNGRIFRLAGQRFDLDATGRTWDLDPAYDLPPADAGPDLILGTPDDIPDGSMSTGSSGSYSGYPVSKIGNTYQFAPGTVASAWLVGRGQTDPTKAPPVPASGYGGPAQDQSVISFSLPLK